MSLTQRTPRRRGVLLLVVMALLALMATVTMTFVLVTGVQMRAARRVALSDIDTDTPEQQLDAAMDQVLRGSNNPSSPIWTHGLIEDLFGHDTRLGPTTGLVSGNSTSLGNGVLVAIVLTFDNVRLTAPALHPNQNPGFYDGRLITMLDGPAAQITRRIVRSIPTGPGSPITLHVMSFGGNTPNALPQIGNKFLINDRPFDGTGFGLGLASALSGVQGIADGSFENTIDHLLNTQDITGLDTRAWPRALLPNHGAIANGIFQPGFKSDLFDETYFDPSGLGGADEDYDAPDYQNEFMAIMVANTNTPILGTKVIKPSYHDPALINYWRNRATPMNAATRRDLARKIMFRPLLEDHPGFAAANTSVPNDFWNTTNTWYKDGPWDVDNDGNGEEDSVWIDLGSPVQTDASGRQYKPLFAILCVDLDGRLNLNAHGSPMHLVRTGTTSPPLARFVGPFADRSGQAFLPIGQGYGPADIMLNGLQLNGSSLFKSVTSTASSIQPYDLYFLLHGNENTGIEGRYGEGQLLGTMDKAMPGRTSQWVFDGAWGISARDDDLDGTPDNSFERAVAELGGGFRDDNFPPRPVKFVDPGGLSSSSEFSGDAIASLTEEGVNIRGLYGTPADIDSDGGIGLDPTGNPIYASLGEGDDAIDDPYEIELTRDRSQRRRAAVNDNTKVADADAPFTPTDLEALLRIYDADVGTLQSRLLALATDTFVNRPGSTATVAAAERDFLRGIFTTESWDTPTASLALGMPELLTAGAPFDSPFELRSSTMLDNKLKAGGMEPAIPTSTLRKLELRKGLYPRFFDGLKFDINRPFGNAFDDDGDGVVDNPGEIDSLWGSLSGGSVQFDYDNDGAVPADVAKQANVARQAMARHLYMLAMMLRHKDAETLGMARLTERELAQWAINVVDFRDRDSIMTGFEYDKDPFDALGWEVDGDLTTTADGGPDRAVAWGVERPELLITETVAGHERGTKDTSSGGGMMGMGDTDYDQVAAPNGWAMVELYNPQSALSLPVVANELYNTNGLELTRKDKTMDSPVWRLAIGQPTDSPKPDDPIRREPKLDNTKIERTVYFTKPGTGVSGNSGDVKYFASGTTSGVPGSTTVPAGAVTVPPGGYVVVGSTNVTIGGASSADLVIGRGAPNPTMRPTIKLRNNVNKLLVTNDGMTPAYPRYNSDGVTPTTIPATAEKIRPPLAIKIDTKIAGGAPAAAGQFNISEPPAGYGMVFDINKIADPPYDQPWDANRQEWYNLNPITTLSTETETRQFKNYNRVYLQRLANPLLPWKATTNPYLTVDSMPFDLHVYSSTAGGMTGGNTPKDIQSRERKGDAVPANGNFNIWRQYAGDETRSDAPAAGTGLLKHTLGYLNTAWHVPGGANGHRWLTADSLNSTVLANDVLAAKGLNQNYFIGAPRTLAPNTPPPWLTWNNRPYVSKYELMLVPKSSPSELLAQFSVRPTAAVNPYTVEEGEFSEKYATSLPSMSHLLNFFHRSDKTGVTDVNNDLYRIFEFVDVPSRFSGLEEMLDPRTFRSTNTSPPTTSIFGWNNSSAPAKRSFAPPYNYISKHREPGKVNINTIFDDGTTWKAILGGFDGYPGMRATWSKVVNSRRGYGDASVNGQIRAFNVNKPTLVARPFRSFSGGVFVPDATNLKHPGIESTLLRSEPSTADASVSTSDPLFAIAPVVPPRPNTDPNKNPFFRYQLINRLSNLVTTRSNVYAVWITVGYFEVEPALKSDYGTYSQPEFDRVFPDGVRLKGELGSDTGEIERHRAFYMVDRLVPVAFERGKTHNTRKTIRLRTIID